MNKKIKPVFGDIDQMLFWTLLFRIVSAAVVMVTVPMRPTLPAWMAEGYQRASYPLLAYSLVLFLFRKQFAMVLMSRRWLLFFDLVITVGTIQLGGSWRSSYFAYTETTVMLFTIVDGKRGAYISAGVLAISAFIKDPSGGLPSFEIFFISDWDMRVGGLFFYAATGAIFGYFHVLMQRLDALSQAKVEETRKRTAMEEKTRMALELHDGAKQMVNAILLRMNPIVKKVQSSRDETGDEVRWVWRGMNYLKNEFDQVMDALKEGSDSGAGKPQNMVSIIEEETKLAEIMTGFRWEIVSASREIPLSPGRQLAFRRFLGEALMNAWKHSGKSNGTITVESGKDRTILTIADKGRGFDYAEKKETKTTGLKSLKYRAQEMKADLAVETAPGRGCKIVLTVPTEP